MVYCAATGSQYQVYMKLCLTKWHTGTETRVHTVVCHLGDSDGFLVFRASPNTHITHHPGPQHTARHTALTQSPKQLRQRR
jgi:hypothetical protein